MTNFKSYFDLDDDKYCFIKNTAYNLVSIFNSMNMDERKKLIDSFNFSLKEKQLFITTLFLPNDIELLSLYKQRMLHKFNELSQKYNVPTSFFRFKIAEYNSYSLDKLIQEGKISEKSAMQNNCFVEEQNKRDSKKDLTAIVDAVFENQLYNDLPKTIKNPDNIEDPLAIVKAVFSKKK